MMARPLNDLLKAAFDQPGCAAAEPGGHPADTPPTQPPEPQQPAESGLPGERAPAQPPAPAPALWFKQSPVRLHPGEKRTVTLLADPAQVPPGSAVEIEADPGLTVTLRADAFPDPGARGHSTLQAHLRVRVTVEPGALLA